MGKVHLRKVECTPLEPWEHENGVSLAAKNNCKGSGQKKSMLIIAIIFVPCLEKQEMSHCGGENDEIPVPNFLVQRDGPAG